MSLLLEALKKAERAKQEKSGKVVTHRGFGEQAGSEIGLEHSGAARAPAKAAGKEPLELSLVDHLSADSKPPTPETRASSSSGVRQAADRVASERQAAAGVFAAKLSARKPTPILTILAAVAVVLAAAGGFYVWQETSRPGIATGPGGNVVTTRPATVAPAPVIASQTPVQPKAAPPMPAPGPEKAKSDESANALEPEATERKPKASPAGRPAATPDSTSAIKIQRTQPVTTVNPTLVSAYQAFVAGDTGAARQSYQRVLETEPNNRDALLGLAAIALKQGQEVEAERYYLRVLELDPRDAVANAGMFNLKKQLDPAQSESRLKLLLAQQPDAGHLHFALGNQYAAQTRWAEAQQAYFKAVSAEPTNADFAFNLAVSLDYLNQRKLALDFYRRAVTLAASGPASFDKSHASARIRELEQQ